MESRPPLGPRTGLAPAELPTGDWDPAEHHIHSGPHGAPLKSDPCRPSLPCEAIPCGSDTACVPNGAPLPLPSFPAGARGMGGSAITIRPRKARSRQATSQNGSG